MPRLFDMTTALTELDVLIGKCNNAISGQAKGHRKQIYRQLGKREAYLKIKEILERDSMDEDTACVILKKMIRPLNRRIKYHRKNKIKIIAAGKKFAFKQFFDGLTMITFAPAQ